MEAPLPRTVVAAIMQFQSDIPTMCKTVICNLKLQKAELQVAVDSAHDQASFAKSTKSELKSELLQANQALVEKDDDANQGEVRYIQSALRCAESKEQVAKEKEKEALATLEALCTRIEERRKAHGILEKHFKFSNGSGTYSSYS